MNDTQFELQDVPEWLPAEDRPAFRAQREIYLKGAADMREKASKIAQDHAQFCMDEANKGGDWKYLKDRADCAAYIAECIRALFTEPQSAAPTE